MNNLRQQNYTKSKMPILQLGNSKEAQSQKKSKPISGLHAQFEQLKKKIRDVQNKNQKIIQKIHNAFNFKKKGPYFENNYEYNQDQNGQNEIMEKYYERISPIKSSGYKSQQYNQRDFDTRSRKNIQSYKQERRINTNLNIQDDNQNYKRLNPQFRQSTHNHSSKSPGSSPLYRNQGSLPQNINKNEITPTNLYLSGKNGGSKKFQNFTESQVQVKNNQQIQLFIQNQKNKYNQLLKQNKKCQQEANRLVHIEQRYHSYSQTSRIIFQSALCNLMEAVIKNNLNHIQKICKKTQLRLLNLSVLIRQAHQDHKSNKVIKEHRRRRSTSRSVRKNQKTDGKITSRSQLAKSQVKTHQSTKKSKEFQQVVDKYEKIIRSKNQQLDNLDKKIKSKEQQCMELKNKIQNIVKKAKQLENQNHLAELNKNNLIQQQFKNKINEQQLIIMQEKSKCKMLNQKVQQLQLAIKQKNNMYSQLKQVNNTIQSKFSSLKNTQKLSCQGLQSQIDKLQKQIQNKSRIIIQLQQNISDGQKRKMEKECEMYVIINKLKKAEQMLQLKENKIQQLQKLLQSSDQIADKSIIMDQSMMASRVNNQNDQVKRLREENQKLQEEILIKKNQIFTILKEKQLSGKKILQLQQKLTLFKKKIQNLEEENLQRSQNSPYSNQQEEEQKQNLQEQLIELNQKCNTLSKTIQNLRTQNLDISSNSIKLQSQLTFTKQNMKQKQLAIQRLKKQNDDLRNKIIELEKLISRYEQQLQMEKKNTQEKITQLERQWFQFQQSNKNNQFDQFTDKRSEISTVNLKSNYNNIATQNEYLNEKLKEAQSIIQTQNIMQQKMINQYRINVEKVKTQLKDKSSTIEKLNNQIDKSRKKIVQLQSKLRQKQNQNGQDQQLNERINQLESQLQQSKDINNKLTEVTKELFQQIKVKQAQKSDFIRQIQLRNHRIVQLQQVIDLQGGSRISSRSHYRQSMKSQMMKQSAYDYNQNQNPHQTNVNGQFDLSLDHSFLDNSQLNVSQLFRQMPQEKLKLKKRQHKLFEKTGQYINSLKESLEQKCKKIRVLQKKIQSLKSSELVRKDYDLSGKQQIEAIDKQCDFKDYQSVQLDNRKGGNHRRFKMLQNDTKLVVQENNMLRQQIELLEQEVQRAEEQQNSLVKMKDLYKEQINKLRKKNQQQTKIYEQQLQKQRVRYQDSQSIHNFMALKQLFIKAGVIMGVSSNQPKKKQQKKKQLEQYIKVIANILKIEQSDKDQIIKNIRAQ